MHTNTVPQYLYDTIANFRKNIHVQYNTRNEERYIVPECRVDIFNKSFIPYVICKWNALPKDVIISSIYSSSRKDISYIAKNCSVQKYMY